MSPDVTTARRNLVLNALDDDHLQTLLPFLKEQHLTLGDVLYHAGEPVTGVQFPTDGVVSIVTDVDAGHRVEVATVGRDGLVGLPLYLGSGAPTETATVQVPGTALTMSSDAFTVASARVAGPLQGAMRRYAQVMFTQLARNPACNRVHQIRPRAARWLLTTADRMQDDTFELTQEFLAQMLAVRRASINEVAQALAEDGAISYAGGLINIVDRQRLHAIACGCYDVLRQTTQQAFPSS